MEPKAPRVLLIIDDDWLELCFSIETLNAATEKTSMDSQKPQKTLISDDSRG